MPPAGDWVIARERRVDSNVRYDSERVRSVTRMGGAYGTSAGIGPFLRLAVLECLEHCAIGRDRFGRLDHLLRNTSRNGHGMPIRSK